VPPLGVQRVTQGIDIPHEHTNNTIISENKTSWVIDGLKQWPIENCSPYVKTRSALKPDLPKYEDTFLIIARASRKK
jgi:hypothetical protein